MAITGGFQLARGPLPISATSASRVFFEGAVLLLSGSLISRVARAGTPGSFPVRMLVGIAVVLIAAAADSSIQRVGDGGEYLAMARNLSRGQPPSLSEHEFDAIAAELPYPLWHAKPTPWLRGADGRYDFPHFWVYSLGAAPFVAVATWAGVHPAAGFGALNLGLLLGASWVLLRAKSPLVAVLFASLMLWWIDKAHAEIFIAVFVVVALLLRETAPAVSIVLLGVATAQMPLLVPLLAASAGMALVRHRPRGYLVIAIAAAVGIAASNPLYYLLRLGIASPLGDTLVLHRPGVRALVTPLIDPNLGIVWFAPALCALAVWGAVMAIKAREWHTILPLLVGGGAILVIATQTPNVNHGGTPGMSRYGVWLMAVLLPLAMRAEQGMRLKPWVGAAAGVVTLVFAAYMLHPRWPDSSFWPAPPRLATLIWTRVPALDNPLPEVFTERLAHVDGIPPLPIATPRCEKALIIGMGTGVSWPPPCQPREVPDACVAPGVMCYANGTRIVPAPRQPGFSP